MKKGELLSIALKFATDKHFGQFDKGGNPYIMHPLKVMYMLKSDDEELNCIALLHDVVEDCGVTYQDLRDIGMTERVIEGVRGMTKLPSETYDDAMNRIKSNPDSIRVKICDLRHNSDIRRLKGVTEKDIKRIEKYHRMFLELKECL